MATISGFVLEGGGTGSEYFLMATGFLVLVEVVIEGGGDAIFLVFSLPFAGRSAATDFLEPVGSTGFCFDKLTDVDGDLLTAKPVFVSGFLAAATLDFAGFATTFVETLALVALTTFTGFGELFAAVFETEAFVFKSDDFIGAALALAGAATFPWETFEAETFEAGTFEAGTFGFSLAVLLLLEVEGFCELFGLFFDALNGNSIIGWTT